MCRLPSKSAAQSGDLWRCLPFWAAGVLWIRLKAGENAWHPANEPHRKIGEEWLIHGIVTGKYPFADQFLEVIAQREREGQAGDVWEA